MSTEAPNMNLDKFKKGTDNIEVATRKGSSSALMENDEKSERSKTIQSNPTDKTEKSHEEHSKQLASSTSSDAQVSSSPKSSLKKICPSDSTMESGPIMSGLSTNKPQASTITTAIRPAVAAVSDNSPRKHDSYTSSTSSKDQSSNQAASNGNNRKSSSHQPTNGSLSDSFTSNEGVRTPNVDNLSKTNLYIRGLHSTTTDDDLYNMCIKFGHISSTKAIFDRTTGCCRGYGFVEYAAPQSAELAVAELTKSGVQAQMARISSPYPSHNQHYSHHNHNHHQQHHHQPHHSASLGHNGDHYLQNIGNNNHNIGNMNTNNHSLNQGNNQHGNNADPTNLYIANLGPNMGEHELELLLSAYGPVVSTRILRDERNNPRGVGFARMETRDKCQEIIEKLNGQMCKGAQEPLLVKFADGGNRKRHHYGNHHASNLQHQHHKVNHEDAKWRETGAPSEHNSRPGYEQHGNITHNNQMTDLAMMRTIGYPRMPPPYPPNMNTGAGYPNPLGPTTSAHQWLPGPGQQWNVIPQHMMQPGSLSSSNHAPAAAYPYGHITQLTSQMQGLQLTHHSGAPIGGFITTPHQWPPVWSHHMAAQQHQTAPLRLATMPNQQASQQQAAPAASETSQNFSSGQDESQDIQSKQINVSDIAKHIQVSAPL